MYSEWGLRALARRTYSSYLPPATIRCGSIASSTATSCVGGPAVIGGGAAWEVNQKRATCVRFVRLAYWIEIVH